MASGPALSVVVVSLGGAEALAAALAALGAQHQAPPFEVVLPASPRMRAWLGGVALPAFARVVDAGADAEDPWRRRAIGVEAATAPVVATIEDHTLPDADWASRVVARHAALPHAAIGGVVEKATPDSTDGWAMYFLDYGRYIPPQAEGPRRFLSACNVTYKRAALETVRSSWTGTMHETTVHFALLARGEVLWLDPGLRVRQRRVLARGEALAELRHHGELFGRDRAAGLSPAARSLRAALAPVVPLVQVARSAATLRRAPSLAGPWLRALPSLLAFAGAWAAGEARGLRA